MNKKNVKLPGFVIWLCHHGQLDEAFQLLMGTDAEVRARLEEMYKPYRDSFDAAAEAPMFEDALSQLTKVWERISAPAGEANVTASDRDADSDGDGEDEKPEMNAGAKAELQEHILMIIDHHNEVVKALRSKSVKFDAVGVQWVLSVL